MTNAESAWKKFLLGGLSCMVASVITNPIDVLKVRLQLQGELLKKIQPVEYKGVLKMTTNIVKEEGIRGLYKGISASLLREGSYSTIRMGGYDVMKDVLKCTDPNHTPLWKKLLAGGTSGMVGAAIANPTDLIKVRMQSEGKLAQGQNPRYNSLTHAFHHIYKNEGLAGLYKGVSPTAQRAALLTAAQLSSYDHIKHFFLNMGVKEGKNLQFISSIFAGFVCAVVTSPIDVVKTRVMNQQVSGAQLKYSSTWDCISKISKAEGLLGFYKGFLPNWMRIGPHTIITFLAYEHLRKLFGIRPI
eukprot:TRINITY_DN13026_c0_g1_i1.p1 TRINITY_DN13026_c0_g1~~TRINITY_DN13026_c0_g1_i1.p1  ORF type:complete len:301 (-),score=50.34 TRINITY_DN13026_c0_g1_i1:69-971(-)